MSFRKQEPGFISLLQMWLMWFCMIHRLVGRPGKYLYVVRPHRMEEVIHTEKHLKNLDYFINLNDYLEKTPKEIQKDLDLRITVNCILHVYWLLYWSNQYLVFVLYWLQYSTATATCIYLIGFWLDDNWALRWWRI